MSGFQSDAGTVQQEAGFGFNGRLWTESYSDALTAHASGGQASATQLASMFNTVSTVATAGDSVQLPVSQPGLSVCVNNTSANPMQVFAQNGSSDTINTIAGSTGVSQMAGSQVWYTCTKAGAWTAEGLGSGYADGNLPTSSSANALTAAGSNQAGATPITTTVAEFGTVAASTGAVLPASAPGLQITVINNGANTLSVYPAGTDKINALSASAAFSMSSPPTVTIFFCTAAGQWWTK